MNSLGNLYRVILVLIFAVSHVLSVASFRLGVSNHPQEITLGGSYQAVSDGKNSDHSQERS